VETCRICSARLFDGGAHCSRCFAPVVPTEEEIATAKVELAAASGRWQPASLATESWRADERHTRTAEPKIESRWLSGVLSFSGPTKIAISLVVVFGVPLIALVLGGLFGMWLVAIWSITVTPRVLRDLWRRTRIS
jgi:hypothetical protein